MSSILKKIIADKRVFDYNPKPISMATTHVAKDFVSLQEMQSSDFQIADIVSEQSGINALRKKNVDSKVEETVLVRLKEVQEQAYKQAYDLGRHEGAEKAFVENHEVLKAKLTDFDSIMSSFENQKTKFLQENETVIMGLIFQIAKKIALREIQLQPESIVPMLNDLMSEVQSVDSIVVKLHPEDMKFVEELRLKKVKEAEGLERVKLVANDNMTKGGCLIETNFGTIVNTVEQRVAKAWAVLESKMPTVNADTEA